MNQSIIDICILYLVFVWDVWREIFTVDEKNEMSDLSSDEKKALKKMLEDWQ